MIVQIWYRGVSKHVDILKTFISTEKGLASSENLVVQSAEAPPKSIPDSKMSILHLRKNCRNFLKFLLLHSI